MCEAVLVLSHLTPLQHSLLCEKGQSFLLITYTYFMLMGYKDHTNLSQPQYVSSPSFVYFSDTTF